MKKLNHRGFSLIELLAVISIMGILFGIAIQAYTTYIEQSKSKGYLSLVQSAETAMNNYIIQYPSSRCMTFDDLYDRQYLERPVDPGNKTDVCRGKVVAVSNTGSGKALDSFTYTTTICCTHYTYQFSNERKTKTKLDACPNITCD